MRVMDDVIADHGLKDELEERLVDETGNTNFWLGSDSDMDEDSDQDDPQASAEAKVSELLEANREQIIVIEAVQGALECRAMATEMERARMQLEDLRAQMLRAAPVVARPAAEGA